MIDSSQPPAPRHTTGCAYDRMRHWRNVLDVLDILDRRWSGINCVWRYVEKLYPGYKYSESPRLSSPGQSLHFSLPNIWIDIMHLYIDQSSQSSVDPTVAFILHILVYASFALLILVVVGAAFCAYFGIGFDIYDYRRIEDGEKDEEAAISISEQKPSDSNHSAYIPGVSYSHRSRYSVSTLLTLLPPPQTCPLPPALRAPVTKPNPIPIPKIVVTSPSGTSVLITGIPYNRRIVRPKPTIPSSTGFLTREKWVNKYVTTLPPPTKSTETGNRDSSLRRKPEGRIGRARSDSFYGGRPIIASGPLPPPSTAASTFTAASPTTATAAITSRPRSATVPAPASTPIVSGSGLPLLSMGPIMSVGIMKRNVNVSGLVSSGSKGKGKERKVQSEGKENVAVAEGC